MMKWFSLKQQNKDDSAPEGGRRTSATQLRIQKDVSELNHLDWYFKDGLWKANHSITCDKGAVNRLESREQCYIKKWPTTTNTKRKVSETDVYICQVELGSLHGRQCWCLVCSGNHQNYHVRYYFPMWTIMFDIMTAYPWICTVPVTYVF